MRKNTLKAVFALVLVIVLAAGAFWAWREFSPGAVAGSKDITLEIVHGDGSVKTLEISTEAESLRGALEPEGLIAGEEGAYGLYLLTVDGETVNESNQEWWCITKGGESLMTGVDDTMIADGEKYEISFTVGW